MIMSISRGFLRRKRRTVSVEGLSKAVYLSLFILFAICSQKEEELKMCFGVVLHFLMLIVKAIGRQGQELM